jgi:hypothetical protein
MQTGASFADQEALRAAADLGNAWAAHHLADLLPELEPSALMAAEIIFARGQLR